MLYDKREEKKKIQGRGNICECMPVWLSGG